MKLGSRFAFFVLGLAVLGACATQDRRVLDVSSTDRVPRAEHTWPAGPGQVARYAYVGELVGASNFRAPSQTRTGARKLLAWLAGLDETTETPLVLQRPQGGVADDDGRVYVTDVSHRGVMVFDEPAGEVLLWRRAEDDIQFVAPIGIAIGRAAEILVTDAELGAVYRLGPDGTPLGAFGAQALRRPTGIARDAARGLIYVADTRASDVKVFDDDGRLVRVIGQPGEAEDSLNAPTHIALGEEGLYVADTLNARIKVFDREGRLRRTIGRRGLYVGQLTRPKGVAVDDDGNIYVVESYYDHLIVFDREGRLLLAIGGTGPGRGEFYLPAGVWTDRRNRIYVADMFNGRVALFQYLGGAP